MTLASPVTLSVVPSKVKLASALSSPAFPVAVVTLLLALLRIFAEPEVPLDPELPLVPEDPLDPDVPEDPLVPDEPEDPLVPDEPFVPLLPLVPD